MELSVVQTVPTTTLFLATLHCAFATLRLSEEWWKKVTNVGNTNDGVKLEDCSNFGPQGILGRISYILPVNSNKVWATYSVTRIGDNTAAAQGKTEFQGKVDVSLTHDVLSGKDVSQELRGKAPPQDTDRQKIRDCVVKLLDHFKPAKTPKVAPTAAQLQQLSGPVPLDTSVCGGKEIKGSFTFVDSSSQTSPESKTIRYEVTKVGQTNAPEQETPFNGQVKVALKNGLVRILSEEGGSPRQIPEITNYEPLLQQSNRLQVNDCIVALVAKKLSISTA